MRKKIGEKEMTEQMITCPNCQTEIPLNEAMASQIKSQIMDDLAEDIAEKNRRLNKRSAEIEALEKKGIHLTKKYTVE